MKKNTKTPRFEVDFQTRLEQRRKATNAVRLPTMGYAPYRVYEIKEKKDQKQKKTLNGFYGNGTGGKSSYTLNVVKSRPTGKTQWQQVIYDYMELIDSLDFQKYEVRWLKPKQATVLRLKGHRVEPTTADDKSTVGPVKLGA